MSADLGLEVDLEPTLSYVVASETLTKSQPFATVSRLPGLQVGAVLGDRYELQQEIGSGGMGKVFAGIDRRLGRRVAVKLIRPDRLSRQGDQMRLAFESEARLGASLLHPAIATVYDYGFHEDTPFAVFEFLDGQSLRDLLRARHRLPLEDVQTIVARLAQALDYAHQKGIVHRDLKPENVRCDEHGQFKVLDLGLAKNFHNDQDWSFAGTPAYASPEQANEVASDGRTDQYALALITYEMLSGERPFKATSWSEMLAKHKNEQAPPLSSFVPDLPDSVRAAVARALDKNPNDRFTSCGEFASALGAQFQVVPTAADKVLCSAPVAEAFSKISVSLRIRRSRMQLALQPQRFWMATDESIQSWPVSSIAKVVISGRELWVTFVESQRRTVKGFRFSSRDSAAAWRQQIEAARGAPPAEELLRIIEDPVLTVAHPDIQMQVLGRCEAFGKWNADAQRALRLKVALQGGNGVVDLVMERLVSPEAVHRRASGTAVRTLDSESRSTLAFRWYGHEVRSACQWLLLLITVHAAIQFLGMLMLSLNGAAANPLASLPYLETGGVVLLYHGAPLALTALLWLLQHPQLLRSTVIANVVLALSPYLAGLALAIGGVVAFRSALPLLGLLLLLDPVGLVIMWAGVTQSRRLWRTNSRLRALNPTRNPELSPSMSTGWLDWGTSAIALLYSVGLSGVLAYSGWEIAAINPKANLRDEWSRLTQIQPGNVEVNQSVAEINAGQYEAAIASSTRAIELNPRSPLGYVNRAAAKANLGRFSEALVDADQAIANDPKCTLAYINRASAHLGLFQNDLALRDAEMAIQLDPAQPLAYLNRGLARSRLGQSEGALQDAETVLRSTPNNGHAYLLRGTTRFQLDRVTGAAADMLLAGTLLKQNYDGLIVLESYSAAERLLRKGNLDAAVEAATGTIEANPQFWAAYLVRGSAYLKQGRTQDALREAETALALQAESAWGMTLRGAARLRLDDARGALNDCTAAISQNPNYISAYRTRASAYAKLGQAVEADADRKRADELATDVDILNPEPELPE